MNLDAQIEGLLNVNVNSFVSWIPLNLFKYTSTLSSLFKTFPVKLFSLKVLFWRLDKNDEITITLLNNWTHWYFSCFYFSECRNYFTCCFALFFHCEVDDFWTFSDISWPCLHPCQTFHTNSWRISCCNETEKQLLQRWNVRVWNHICTEQEVFLPYWVTPTSPQSQRRVCCRSHQDRVLGIVVWWVFHFLSLDFARSVLITAVEYQQHSLWINEMKLKERNTLCGHFDEQNKKNWKN